MKCMSCTADIPATWVHCINSNECPSCGGSIMDNQSQMLLAEVRDAMNQMPSNPEGLAGWLLSNYKLVKVGDAEPTTFHQRAVDETPQQSKQSNAGPKPVSGPSEATLLYQNFLKRTGVKLSDVNALKKSAGTMANMDIGSDEDSDSEEDYDVEGSDPFTINPAASPAVSSDHKELMKQKQKDARNAIRSGSGGFRRG